MQTNVNAENVISSLVQNFGEDYIQTCDGGIIKLQVKELRNGDILSISNLLQWSDIQIKRSDTRLLILFIPKPSIGEYSEEIMRSLHQIKGETYADYEPFKQKNLIPKEDAPISHKTVRDFYEFELDQEARMAAFDNTAKNKLDLPANNLAEAILQSFYISETPQGTCYWQDIICFNNFERQS